MTTEVLRNMIYARRDLGDLEVVVLDEVHFLQDAYRGPVWEEVIIHLPMHVRLVCLSATVSNAAELAEWIETVRGATEVVVEERRPVQLDNFYYVTDLTNDRRRMLPTIVDGHPNPDALRLDASAVRFRRGRRDERAPRGSGQRKLATPGRVETVEELAERLAAAGDLLHLQPRPVRRGGAGVRRRRIAPHRSTRSARASTRSPPPGWRGCRPPISRCSATTASWIS